MCVPKVPLSKISIFCQTLKDWCIIVSMLELDVQSQFHTFRKAFLFFLLKLPFYSPDSIQMNHKYTRKSTFVSVLFRLTECFESIKYGHAFYVFIMFVMSAFNKWLFCSVFTGECPETHYVALAHNSGPPICDFAKLQVHWQLLLWEL